MNRNTLFRFPNRQQGVSLPVALILLVPLTLLGLTLANRNNLEELMAGAQRDGQQALMNAESGLAMGMQELQTLVENRVLYKTVNPSATATVNDVLTLTDYPYTEVTYGGGSMSSGLARGDVTVVVLDNDDGDNDLTSDSDGRVILRSTGDYMSGERQVEAIVYMNFTAASSPSSGPPLTIFSEEYIDMSGNPNIHGPDALVHSNAYVHIGGTTTIAGEIQQASTNTGDWYQKDADGVWGGATNSTRVTSGVARVQTPYVYPPVYKGMATRYFTRDCDVYDGAPGYTNPLTGDPSTYLYNANNIQTDGFYCDHSSGWNKMVEQKETVNPGFYYVEGNVKLPNEIGTSSNPVRMSIVAEGWIQVSGNPFIAPYYDTQVGSRDLLSVASQDELDRIDPNLVSEHGVYAKDAVLLSDEIQLLAGGDLQINGNYQTNSDYNYVGVMASHTEFDISGEPRMTGAIIAENAKYTADDFFFDNMEKYESFVEYNKIGGNPEIYGSSIIGGSGGQAAGPPIGANLQGWRETIE